MSKYILTDIDIDGYLKVSNYIKTESFMEATRYFHTDGYVHAGTYVYGAQKVFDGLGNVLSEKQDKQDDDLTTTSKTIVGAINELNADIDELNDDIDDLSIGTENLLSNSGDLPSGYQSGSGSDTYFSWEVLDETLFGNKICRLTGKSKGNPGFKRNVVDLVAGKTYTFTSWFRFDEDTSESNRPRMVFYQSATQSSTGTARIWKEAYLPSSMADGEWQAMQITLKCTESGLYTLINYASPVTGLVTDICSQMLVEGSKSVTVWTENQEDIINIINNKQDKQDDDLETTDKTIVGAINELNGKDYSDASTAETLKTPRTISLGTGVVSTATSFDGSSNITIPVTNISEAYLKWGGRNFTGGYSPIDASMIGVLGANRFAYMPPSAISIEYSRDGGTTWSNHSISDSSIGNLFSDSGGSIFTIGNSTTSNLATSDCLSRVTINTGDAGLYTALNKFMIYCSTNGSQDCYCTIEKATEANPDTYYTVASHVPIAGWSGYNIINVDAFTTYGNTPSQYGRVRFTFGCTSHPSTTYAGLAIYCINGFGGVGWEVPSNTARYGTVYYVDGLQRTFFPNSILPANSNTCDLGAESLGYLNSYIDGSYTRLLRICHPDLDQFSPRFAMGYDDVNSTGYSLRLYPSGATESYKRFIIDGFNSGTYVTGPLNTRSISPITSNSYNIGSSSKVYKNIYATNFVGDLTGNADTATTATKLGSSDVGSGIKPIYLSSGVATVSSSTVGSHNSPIYMSNGAFNSCGEFQRPGTYELNFDIDQDGNEIYAEDNVLVRVINNQNTSTVIIWVPQYFIEGEHSCIIEFELIDFANPSFSLEVHSIGDDDNVDYTQIYYSGSWDNNNSKVMVCVVGDKVVFKNFN